MTYGDKQVDRRGEVAEIRAQGPSLRHVVHVPYGPNSLPDTVDWAEMIDADAGPAGVRAGAVRPPAVRAVLLRHDREA